MEFYGNINSIFNYYIFHMSLETVGQLEGKSPDVEELESEDLDYETPDGFTQEATLAVPEPGESVDLDYETQEAVAQESASIKLKQGQRPLKDRLLWKESKIRIGDGAYRSMEATLRVPTMLGFVVDIIERNRKMLAAAGMVTSLAAAGEQAKTLYEMHPFESTSPIAKQTPDPAKEILVPYTEIGGVNVQVSPLDCQSYTERCQINIGSGPRDFYPNLDADSARLIIHNSQTQNFKQPKFESFGEFLKPDAGNVGKYQYDPKKSPTSHKSGL